MDCGEVAAYSAAVARRRSTCERSTAGGRRGRHPADMRVVCECVRSIGDGSCSSPAALWPTLLSEASPGAGDPRQPRDAVAAGRRARRRPDAGEPLLRPLLRHAARRARLRRPAPVTLPAGKPVWHQPDGDRRVVLPFRPDARQPRPAVHRGPRPRLEAPRTALERRQLRPVGAAKTPRRWRTCTRERHPVPLRAGRRLHDLRRLPLLAARPDRPEPLLHVDRLGRQRRHRAAAR